MPIDRADTDDRTRWWLWLGLITALALGVRLAYVLLLRRDSTALAGDAYQFHHGANLLADGKGFVGALAYQLGSVRETAQHPPLYTLVLAAASSLGLRSVVAHQLWSSVIGTATVLVLGLAGRRIAGPRAGLFAAFLGALYPNLWLWDGLVLSETLGMLTTALVVLAAYHLWHHRTPVAALVLGSAGGLAALTRAEAALFVPAIVVPLALAARSLGTRRRLGLVAVAGGVTGVMLAPWVVYNAGRFENPPLGTSTNFPQTLAAANCDETYYGRFLGSRSLRCIPDVADVGGDETEVNERYQRVASRYIRSHLTRLPVVVVARLGRAWGVYQPLQQLRLDTFFERRELGVAQAGFAMYWFVAPAAVLGALVARRRKIALVPLLAVLATVTLAVALTFGQTRYRTSAEIPLVLLAAVWVDDVLTRLSAARALSRAGSP